MKTTATKSDQFSRMIAGIITVFLMMAVIFLLGVPWLIALKLSGTPFPASVNAASSELERSWCLLSEAEPLHDLMESYLSFCMQTMTSQGIEDIDVTPNGYRMTFVPALSD